MRPSFLRLILKPFSVCWELVKVTMKWVSVICNPAFPMILVRSLGRIALGVSDERFCELIRSLYMIPIYAIFFASGWGHTKVTQKCLQVTELY